MHPASAALYVAMFQVVSGRPPTEVGRKAIKLIGGRELLPEGLGTICGFSSIRSFRQAAVVRSEWTVARTPLSRRRPRSMRLRYLFRLANKESMRNREDEGLLGPIVAHSDHTASPLRNSPRLEIPA